MNIPKRIRVVEGQFGETVFVRKVEHTFAGGLIILLFSATWLSIWTAVAMDFAPRWTPTWKNVEIGGLLFVFAGVGLGLLYLGLFCWFGKICIKMKDGVFCHQAGIFGIGRKIICPLSEVQDIAVRRRERKDRWRTTTNYQLILQLRNGRVRKIPFGNDEASARFFAEYITENL